MSVIQESQFEDEVIVIQEFNASPDGEPFAWDTSHCFRVGERVRYVGYREDGHDKDNPGLGWGVIFDASDGKRYVATQTYFVTDECWQGLKKFFARRLLRDPKRHTKTSN